MSRRHSQRLRHSDSPTTDIQSVGSTPVTRQLVNGNSTTSFQSSDDSTAKIETPSNSSTRRGRASSDSSVGANLNSNESESFLFRSLDEFRAEADRLGQLAKQRAIVVGERIRKLLAFDELDDDFLRHNPHIRSGYRTDYSFSDAFWSLFQVHNELLNVWTHLLSAAYFVYLGVVEWFTAQSLVIVIYLAGATVMFSGSAVFHLFQAMGVHTSKSLVKLDYVGILVQIALSFVTALHYSFFCADDARLLYQAIIVVLCLVGLWVCLSDSFSKPDYAVARVLLFGSIIAYAVVPWIHMIAVHGISGHEIQELGIGFVYMVGAYFVGAVIYATRWPERSWPGRFDVVGGSHQLWHLCVTVAAYLHYVTLIDYRAFRDQFGCAAPPSQ